MTQFVVIQTVSLFVSIQRCWDQKVAKKTKKNDFSLFLSKLERFCIVFLAFHIQTFKTMYSWTSLYARDRDSKNRLSHNEFAYKKTKDDCY